MKVKVVVTGAGGQLAGELQVLSSLEDMSSSYPDLDFAFFTREELSIENAEQVNKLFQSLQPQFCINCAAYTAVDKAETDREEAFLINGTAAGILAAACNQFNCKLIHISTDYVFNGKASIPYKETAAADPINIYGASKLKGEELVIKNNNAAVVIRTSWVYSVFGNNIVKTFVRLMKEKETIKVVNDQRGSPTYAADLATVILQIINSGKWVPGIYNYTNEGILSWYEFATAIKVMIGSNCEIIPVPSSEYPTPARRPHYSGLDKEKIKATYGVALISWKDSLKKCIEKLS